MHPHQLHYATKRQIVVTHLFSSTTSGDTIMNLKSMAELSEELKIILTKEVSDNFSDIKHAPTIGDMYEGITKKLIERSLPEESRIQVVNGFIKFGENGELSGQQDCLVVDGPVIRIPETNHYKVDVRNVIAAIEVKANMYKKELNEALTHLAKLRRMEIDFWRSDEWKKVRRDEERIRREERTSQQFMGIKIDSRSSLSSSEEYFASLIRDEARGMARIAYSPRGYTTSTRFRSALIAESSVLLKQYPAERPNLVGTSKQVLIKNNGQPYRAQGLQFPKWDALATSSNNTIEAILEVIWTKIAMRYRVNPQVWGDDLIKECAHLLLTCDLVENEDSLSFVYDKKPSKIMEEKVSSEDLLWQPVVIAKRLHEICTSYSPLELDPTKLTVEERDQLISNGLFVVKNDGSLTDIAAELCYVDLKDQGGTLFGDNGGGRFEKWLNSEGKQFGDIDLTPRSLIIVRE